MGISWADFGFRISFFGLKVGMVFVLRVNLGFFHVDLAAGGRPVETPKPRDRGLPPLYMVNLAGDMNLFQIFREVAVWFKWCGMMKRGCGGVNTVHAGVHRGVHTSAARWPCKIYNKNNVLCIMYYVLYYMV